MHFLFVIIHDTCPRIGSRPCIQELVLLSPLWWNLYISQCVSASQRIKTFPQRSEQRRVPQDEVENAISSDNRRCWHCLVPAPGPVEHELHAAASFNSARRARRLAHRWSVFLFCWRWRWAPWWSGKLAPAKNTRTAPCGQRTCCSCVELSCRVGYIWCACVWLSCGP